MDRIHELARRYSIRVIEDASHAIGGSYKQLPIGSCRYSDMAVLSFHPVKIVTTGEGGMVLTNDEELYQKLAMLRTHGITRNPKLMHGKSHGPWYYEQVALGLNYRMTDIQATLGTSQLKRLPQFIERRRALAKRYDRAFAGLPVTTPWQSTDGLSAYHLYVIRLRLGELRKTHLQVFEELQKALIQVNLHYIPVHLQPYYGQLGFKAGDFPEAERYYGEAISLPMYYGLSDEDQDYIIATLGKVLGA
jgi:dTDP-4-amino-4,6-dideoxygalactose transaminase